MKELPGRIFYQIWLKAYIIGDKDLLFIWKHQDSITNHRTLFTFKVNKFLSLVTYRFKTKHLVAPSHIGCPLTPKEPLAETATMFLTYTVSVSHTRTKHCSTWSIWTFFHLRNACKSDSIIQNSIKTVQKKIKMHRCD